MNIHLIQLEHSNRGRRVGLVEEPNVTLLQPTVTSCYQLFDEIINGNKPINNFISEIISTEVIPYQDIYHQKHPWRMLAPIDCPDDPMKCILSGTGLTHKASAENRQKMHESEGAGVLTDSMKMYLWGEEGGKPGGTKIGVQPEWFYKGNGTGLKGHRSVLTVPNYADDGGEEPEIAGVYFISNEGFPYRLGFVQANEFSDHVMEKKNYLYLAPSKIRTCAIGPELVLSSDFKYFHGTVSIIRNGVTHWSRSIQSGEEVMAHSLANLEHHHFKYPQHRIPGQVHIHFFGASAFSFGEGIQLQHGDEMHVSFENLGRPLINTISIDTSHSKLVEVKSVVE